MKWRSLSRVWLCVTPWTAAHQALLSMGFSRQEHCSGLSFPPPGDFPNPGIRCESPALPAQILPAKGESRSVGLGVWNQQIQTAIHRTDTRQSFTVGTRNYIQHLVITYSGKWSEKICMYITEYTQFRICKKLDCSLLCTWNSTILFN